MQLTDECYFGLQKVCCSEIVTLCILMRLCEREYTHVCFGSVTFYDTGRMSFDCLGRITALENAPMCATWLRVAENDKLLFGDELGILHTYTFNDEWGGCNSYTIIFSLKHRVIIMRMEYTH